MYRKRLNISKKPAPTVFFLILITFISLSMISGCYEDKGVGLLHAEKGLSPGIFDDEGRQVILRGVNYNSLGDYYEVNNERPAVIPYNPADIAEMASAGINTIRLVISWSMLEPERGVINEDYIAQIREVVEEAAENSIWVVLDMHQDQWGKMINTPEGEQCLPGAEPAIGYDGAPEWATFTDGFPTCKWFVREFSPAANQAFQSFWFNRQDIQDELISVWARLAEEFAADVNVAGYDLFNEPYPGFTVNATNIIFLGSFYNKCINAIRNAEDSVSGGNNHIIFFEPSVHWSMLGATLLPLPLFTLDNNIVFAPHLYAMHSPISPLSTAQCFSLADAAAKLYAVDFWIGEWGWGEPEENEAEIAEFAGLEDSYLVGSAMWQWRMACGDPHVYDFFDGDDQTETISLKRNGCPDDSNLGYVAPYYTMISRSYPRCAPGRVNELVSDPYTGEMTVSGSTDDQGILDLWVPDRGLGTPSVSGVKIKNTYINTVDGGWRILIIVNDDYTVNVNIPGA